MKRQLDENEQNRPVKQRKCGITLARHQIEAVKKMREMEGTVIDAEIFYGANISAIADYEEWKNKQMSSQSGKTLVKRALNAGFLVSETGSGKTYAAIELCTKRPPARCQFINTSLLTTDYEMHPRYNINLIVAPGNLCLWWQTSFQKYGVPCRTFSKSSDIDALNLLFEGYRDDGAANVLVSHSVFCHLIKNNFFKHRHFWRLIIDECDDANTPGPVPHVDFLWIISATFESFLKKATKKYGLSNRVSTIYGQLKRSLMSFIPDYSPFIVNCKPDKDDPEWKKHGGDYEDYKGRKIVYPSSMRSFPIESAPMNLEDLSRRVCSYDQFAPLKRLLDDYVQEKCSPFCVLAFVYFLNEKYGGDAELKDAITRWSFSSKVNRFVHILASGSHVQARIDECQKDFAKGKNVLIVINARNVCAGLNIPFVTDVFLDGFMPLPSLTQALGRAQRLGRTCRLNVIRSVPSLVKLWNPELVEKNCENKKRRFLDAIQEHCAKDGDMWKMSWDEEFYDNILSKIFTDSRLKND
jgi:hypothetical protein